MVVGSKPPDRGSADRVRLSGVPESRCRSGIGAAKGRDRRNARSVQHTRQKKNAMKHDAKGHWPQVLVGLRGLGWGDLPRGLAAGVTLAAMILPLNIGYAQVAGLEPTAGLYAAIIPLLVYAVFTSSRHLVSGPDATVGAMLGAALIGLAAPGDALRLDYALALALLSGVLFLVFWAFRLAFLANFLSRAVLAGFVTGLAIEVLTNQIRKILGVPHGGEGQATSAITDAAHGLHEAMATSLDSTGYFLELFLLIQSVPHANLYSVAIGAAAFLIVRLMKRFAPKIPGALVALVVLTLAVAVFDLDQKGVSVLGNLPSGLPALTFPSIPIADYIDLLPGALALVAILMCEGLLLSRSYASKHNYKADGDQLMFAYGAMNLASAFSGSLISGPSPSRSAAMEASGANSQLPSLIAAAVVAIILMFFTESLAFLPNAALAGIVANAVLSLIEFRELREFWHVRRSEFWVAAICIAGVLVLGPLRGVLIAFLMTTIDVIARAARPWVSTLGESVDGSHLIPASSAEASNEPGLVVYRFGAPLYFANANTFVEDVERLAAPERTSVRWFVLDAEAIIDMDTSGAEAMHQAMQSLAARGVSFGLSRANPPLIEQLGRYHLLDQIDPAKLFDTNRAALTAYRASSGASAEDVAPTQKGNQP